MKKLFLPVFILFISILVACGSEDEPTETSISDEKGNDETAVEMNHPEVLFTYTFDKDDRYDFTGIDASIDGNTVLFTTKEEIKRDSQRYEFIIIGDDEAKNIKELSEASEEDLEGRRCSRTFISPDGRYLTYSCARAENWFVVYDTVKQQIVHHQENLEDRSLRIFGITNHMEVLLENNDGNMIAILDLKSEEMQQFSIPELSGIEDDHFTNVSMADDGKKILMNNQHRIFMLDTETSNLEQVMNAEPYLENFKEEIDSVGLGTVRISPNGKYAFFLLGASLNRENVYQSIHFVNVETNERRSFTDHVYRNFRSIDNDGNMLLGDNEEMYIYNIDSDAIYHIPNVRIGVYTEYMTLTGDGNHVYYADRRRDEEDQPVYELFHLAIEDLDTYEMVDFEATIEDTDALLDEVASTDNTNNSGDALRFTPVQEDVRKLMEERWEESANTLYPTSFPEEVSSINDTLFHEDFRQTIFLDSDEFTKRRDLVYTVNSYPDSERKDFCIDDDLELEKTEDGVDYYFYLFSNEDAELAFVMDDLCYELKGKGFSKEEMFDVIDSLEAQGKRIPELPLAEIKFPTVLPQQETEVRRYHTSKQGANYNFFVNYYGGKDALEITYRVTTNEPNEFEHDNNVAVEVSDGSEAYYNPSTLYLYMFDGDYYYSIRAEASNDVRNAIGGEEKIEAALIEIANSLE